MMKTLLMLLALALANAQSGVEKSVGVQMTVVWDIIKYSAQCKSKDTSLGRKSTLKQCAEAVKARGGEFFIYGKPGNKYDRQCRQEHTASRKCPEGLTWDRYDFFQLMPDQPLTPEPTEYRGTMVNRIPLGSYWKSSEYRKHCCQGEFLGTHRDDCFRAPENNDGTCGGWVSWGMRYQCAVNADGKCRYSTGYACNNKCTAEPTVVPTIATAEPTEATGEPTEATGEPTEATGEPTEATGEPTEATGEPTEATKTEATISVYRVRGSYCTETVGCTSWIDKYVAPREGVNVGTCAEQGYETYCSEKSRSAALICDEDGVETTFSKQKSVCDPSMETKTLRFVDAEYPEVCEETTITDCLLSYERYVRDGWVEGSCAELDINIACPDETHTSEQKCIRSSRGGRSNSLKMMITEVTYVNEKGRFFCDSLSTTEKPAETTPATEPPLEQTIRHVVDSSCTEVTMTRECQVTIDQMLRIPAWQRGSCAEAEFAVPCSKNDQEGHGTCSGESVVVMFKNYVKSADFCPADPTKEPTEATREPTLGTAEPTQEPTEALDCCRGDYVGKYSNWRDPCLYAYDRTRQCDGYASEKDGYMKCKKPQGSWAGCNAMRQYPCQVCADEQSNALFLLLEDFDAGILVNIFALIGCFALLYGAINALRNRGKSYSPIAQNTNDLTDQRYGTVW